MRVCRRCRRGVACEQAQIVHKQFTYSLDGSSERRIAAIVGRDEEARRAREEIRNQTVPVDLSSTERSKRRLSKMGRRGEKHKK